MMIQDMRTPGDIVDRLVILAMKVKRFRKPDHVKTCQGEWDVLTGSLTSSGLRANDPLDRFGEIEAANTELWDLEDLVRSLERDHLVTPHLPPAVQRIQKVNRARARARRDYDEAIKQAGGPAWIMSYSTVDCLADKIAIGLIAAKRRRDNVAEESALARRGVWLDAGLPNIFESDSFRQLYRANNRLWDIKDVIDAGFEQPEDAALVKACRSLYLTNDARCRAKAQIARLSGSAMWDPKEHPTYTPPPEWNEATLNWLP
jgi:hypothetical protein